LKTPEEFAEAMKDRGVAAPGGPTGDFVVTPRKKTKPANMWWPEVGTLDQAIAASNLGFLMAMFVAVVNAIAATISLVQHTTIGGINAYGYVDAGLFALAGWGIRCRSRMAAVAGLLFFLLEKVYQFATQPKAAMGLLMALFILGGFTSAVRGTFAYHRLVPEGHDANAKPIMLLGVDLRRPMTIWVTALLCVAVLYKVAMGWVGENLLFFVIRAVAFVLAAMTLHAIFQRPAWGRILTAFFSLCVAALMVFIAVMIRPPSVEHGVAVWVVLVIPAMLYVYAACFGKPVRQYFARPARS